jgi:hypothetical protein
MARTRSARDPNAFLMKISNSIVRHPPRVYGCIFTRDAFAILGGHRFYFRAHDFYYNDNKVRLIEKRARLNLYVRFFTIYFFPRGGLKFTVAPAAYLILQRADHGLLE